MYNLPTSQTEQDSLPVILDDISMNFSVDTAPSLSEASGIADSLLPLNYTQAVA